MKSSTDERPQNVAVIRPRRMDDFRPDADHELELARESPGLLEQDIDRHLGTGLSTNRREANFQLEPVLDRRHLESERAAWMKAFGPRPVAGCTQLQDQRVVAFLLAPDVLRLEILRRGARRQARCDKAQKNRRTASLHALSPFSLGSSDEIPGDTTRPVQS